MKFSMATANIADCLPIKSYSSAMVARIQRNLLFQRLFLLDFTCEFALAQRLKDILLNFLILFRWIFWLFTDFLHADIPFFQIVNNFEFYRVFPSLFCNDEQFCIILNAFLINIKRQMSRIGFWESLANFICDSLKRGSFLPQSRELAFVFNFHSNHIMYLCTSDTQSI